MRVLVVEDEKKLSALLKKGLETEQCVVTVVGNGAEALDLILHHSFDAVVLDIMLPGLNGLEVVKLLRGKRNKTPVLMLTARDSAADIIGGLNFGADDYLTKPFSFDVLSARRGAVEQSPTLQAYDLRLNPATQEVRRGNKVILPYAREAETRTLGLLENAFRDAQHGISNIVVHRLQTSAARDVPDLLPFLEARGSEYIRDAEEKLIERGEAEAKAMREILETQKKHIQATYTRHEKMDDRQLRLNYGEELEKLRQLELSKRYWAKRLDSIQTELQTEPDRIRGQY